MKPKFYTAFLLFIALFISGTTYAQWQPVGSVAFSAGQVAYTSMAVDQSGTPYIAYQDLQNNNSVTVKKYSGGSWVTVGQAGLTGGAATYISLAIDSATGTPYVAFSDSLYAWSVTVQKFNGTSWEVVGGIPGFTTEEADYISLAIGSDGTPYVAFEDYGNNFKLTVERFSGSQFAPYGAPGFSAGAVDYVNLKFDRSTGTAYVAYEDESNNSGVTVDKFNGSNWVAVGSTGFTPSGVSYVSMAIDNSGTPYVAFSDNGADPTYAASVMKFNGTAWAFVSVEGLSAGEADYISLAINNNGVPYIAYNDNVNSGKVTVEALTGGNWVNVGSADFSASEADYNSLVIDHSNNVYVGYDDYGNSHTATVMKYNASSGIREADIVSSLNVYPNPSQGKFTVQVKSEGDEHLIVSLLSLTGQIILQNEPVEINGTYLTTMDAGSLAKGVYILQVRNSNGVETRKLEVE